MTNPFTSKQASYGNALAPGEWEMQGQQIMRQRKLAEALQQQADDPLQGQMVSGIYVAPSWTQGAAKLAKALSGKYQMAQADEQEKTLSKQIQQDRTDTLNNWMKAANGTPAQQLPDDIMGPARPAVAGDSMAAAQILMGAKDPSLQQFGMQQIQAEQERKRLAAALGGAPAGQNQAAGASAPGFDRNGVPLDVAQSLLAIDPSGKQYGEFLRELRKPHFTPTGTATQMGTNGTVSMVPGADAAIKQITKAQKDAESPYEIVEVPMSDGSTMKMPKDQALKILSQSAQPTAQQASTVPPQQNMANVQSNFVDPSAMQQHLAKMPEGPDKELVKAAMARDGVKPVVAGRTQTPADKIRAENQAKSEWQQIPEAAVKEQQALLDVIGTMSGINADLNKFGSMIDDGKLKLGPLENLKSKVKNVAGVSDPNSANYQSFVSTLEKLRNDSLKLNNGVQTEGDAQRAWNELFTNINDPKVVRQRISEVQALNERAANLKRMNIDVMRKNYNAQPLDVAPYQSQPSAYGNNAGGWGIQRVK